MGSPPSAIPRSEGQEGGRRYTPCCTHSYPLHRTLPFPLNTQEPGNAMPVIVAGKDQGEVDNDYFLMPVSIKDHVGPLENAFPCENRLLPQGA